jgi:hypothetical protein
VIDPLSLHLFVDYSQDAGNIETRNRRE